MQPPPDYHSRSRKIDSFDIRKSKRVVGQDNQPNNFLGQHIQQKSNKAGPVYGTPLPNENQSKLVHKGSGIFKDSENNKGKSNSR